MTDGTSVATTPLTLDVVNPLALAQPRLTAEVGRALKPTTLTATGGRSPYTWEVVGAPDWIRFDPLPALLNGTPPAAGPFPLQISVKDAYGTTATLDPVIIVNARLAMKTANLRATGVGKLYRATLRTAGGVPPFTWRATSGTFPAGIRLNRRLGVLSGKPGKPGAYPLTFRVTDSLGATSAGH